MKNALAEEITRLAAEYSQKTAIVNITEKQVREVLTGFKRDFEALSVEHWKDLIRSLVERIDLDKSDLTFRIHDKIAVPESSLPMASPRGGHLIPQLQLSSRVIYL